MNNPKTMYRLAVALTIVTAFLLIWLSLGVGIIGADGDRANVMYFAVVAIGFIGALLGRFRPLGMSRALVGMALAQTVIATIAVVAKLGYPWSGPLELILLTGFFVVMFGGAAWLFHRSAQGQPTLGTV
jgi:hypothetical protein